MPGISTKKLATRNVLVMTVSRRWRGKQPGKLQGGRAASDEDRFPVLDQVQGRPGDPLLDSTFTERAYGKRHFFRRGGQGYLSHIDPHQAVILELMQLRRSVDWLKPEIWASSWTEIGSFS